MIFFTIVFCFIQFCDSCIPTQQLETTTTTTTTTTTATPLSCLTGWTLFNRGSYSWCMKIAWVSGNGQSMDNDCLQLNSAAVPSGFESVSEISTMMSVARSEKSGTYYLFIGAQKYKSCQLVAVTATCTTTSSFYWTDGYTSGYNGFNFAAGEPSYSQVYNSGLYWYRVLIMVNTANDYLYAVNKLDVHDGVVCGMKAQYY